MFDESCDCGKKRTRVLLNCGKLRVGCRPDSECLHPARHDYLSRSGELFYAVRLEKVFESSEFARIPCCLDGKRCLADVDHFGTEKVRNFDDLVAPFGGGAHFEQGELAFDGVFVGEVVNLVYAH